jgi:hypothetical protein
MFFLKRLINHRDELQISTSFKKEYWMTVNKYLETVRTDVPLIGVHWRQSDYRIWNAGKFWISAEELSQQLHEIQSRFGPLQFVICTDGEKVSLPIDKFEYSPFTDPVHDLLLLSKCKAVFGSHSTFGAFASFIGNIPHIELQDPKNYQNFHHKGFRTDSIVDNEGLFNLEYK